MKKLNQLLILFSVILCIGCLHNSSNEISSIDSSQIGTSAFRAKESQIDTRNSDGKQGKSRREEAVLFMKDEIIYDGNFNPSILTKLKNNTNYSIIGIEYHLSYFETDIEEPKLEKCGSFTVRRKVACKPKAITTIQFKIPLEKITCDKKLSDYAGVRELVFSNGKKYTIGRMLGNDKGLYYFNDELMNESGR